MKRKAIISIWGVLLAAMLFAGCKGNDGQNAEKTSEDVTATEVPVQNTPEADVLQEEVLQVEEPVQDTVEAEMDEVEEEPVIEEETLGNPRSSYGLGSAAYLRGKNVLVSLFVTTPESSWSEEEQKETLDKIQKAVSYIEQQADAYEVESELLYDFTQFADLKEEAQTDFLINEETDFLDRLDEEIALWQEEKLSYEALLEKYEADGIATMIFVNNPGISYAIVYDGTDSKKETMILFAEDYYQPGKEETATSYAHEILHVFGAHDLYEEAEFTAEVSDYVALTYPDEIMYTVAETGGSVMGTLSPITAYHLGWIDEAEEVKLFPQLVRE